MKISILLSSFAFVFFVSSWLVIGLERRDVLDGDCFGDAAAGAEGGFDFQEGRFDHGDEVVEDRVRDVLVEDSLVAVTLQVVLQALELDALFVGRIRDRDSAEVGLASFGADRGELRGLDFDLVIAVGELILEGFKEVARIGHRAAPVEGPCIVA